MAYEFERDEWRSAIATLTESQRAGIRRNWYTGGDPADNIECPGCPDLDDDDIEADDE